MGSKQKKKVEKKAAPATKTAKSTRPVGLVGFVEDTRYELKRVTWPSSDKVVKASLIILVIVVMSTLFIAGIDLLFTRGLFWLREMIS